MTYFNKRLSDEELTDLAKFVEEKLIKHFGDTFGGEGYTPVWEDVKKALDKSYSRHYDAYKICKELNYMGWEIDEEDVEVIGDSLRSYADRLALRKFKELSSQNRDLED